MTKRNIEEIRRKNLEENQRFLNELRINNIRNDLIQSARLVTGKDETKKEYHKIHYEKVERITRYSLKVKSGEIQPSTIIPQGQYKINKKRKQNPSKWTLFYKNIANPYERVYKPRARN
ncbi:unnamed protein product [Adineta steineri]|uniref:Uncharacterized protein n=1 Tax=Adineta steineri TaxID=433720 RepID=A0A819C0D0_9BILA|nr:unnamed protein product [Adineta steineri]CAF3810921.1 unnamed protein product [Adineta steineri]